MGVQGRAGLELTGSIEEEREKPFKVPGTVRQIPGPLAASEEGRVGCPGRESFGKTGTLDGRRLSCPRFRRKREESSLLLAGVGSCISNHPGGAWSAWAGRLIKGSRRPSKHDLRYPFLPGRSRRACLAPPCRHQLPDYQGKVIAIPAGVFTQRATGSAVLSARLLICELVPFRWAEYISRPPVLVLVDTRTASLPALRLVF